MSDLDRFYFGPCGLGAEELSDAQIKAFSSEWIRKSKGRPVLMTPLPRRARLRLAVTRVIDTIAIKLVDHGHIDAARRLWAATSFVYRHKR